MTIASAGAGVLDIRPATSEITWADRWDHLTARLGYKRFGHTVEPGLYSIGSPSADSPVFVTANYTLSFDSLRSALAGVDGYILALDTGGVNVWCAAGKGVFGTDELVRSVEKAKLREVVAHRRLILPQLGAPGVAAHEVKKRCGFKVEYGPVRAVDLPGYIEAEEATPRMRKITFPLRDRLVLIPVELTQAAPWVLLMTFLLWLAGGWLAAAAAVAAAVAGLVLFPALLPFIPFTDFSAKGFLLGLAAAIALAGAAARSVHQAQWWSGPGWAVFHMLFIPSVTAFLALNFTGSTTFTSQTGVRREIKAYVPVMFWMFVMAVALAVVLSMAGIFAGGR